MENYNQQQQYYQEEDYGDEGDNGQIPDDQQQIYDELNLGQEEQQYGETANSMQSAETDNTELWKKFGRGNDVGNMLYGMYGVKQKPKINYPAVKIKKKPTPAEEMKMPKNNGPCPQKTQIEYPDIGKKSRYKFHAVDFIPRKKHEEEILPELEKMKKQKAVAYGARGRDRHKMIEELQEINRFGDKKRLEEQLAREAQHKAQMEEAAKRPIDNNTRLRFKYNKQIAANAMKHYEEKYGKSPAAYILAQPSSLAQAKNEQDHELEDLFDTVAMEIEERQTFLEEMTKNGPNKEVEDRMKKEIVERIAELQKIKELQSKNFK